MSVSPATLNVAGVIDHPSAHDVRSEHDRAPHEFAGLLAGAVNAHPKAPDAKRPAKDGTSELDRPDDQQIEPEKAKKLRSASTKAAATSDDTDVGTDVGTNVTTSQTGVVQAVNALDPELQAKLARVMSRMRDETGHDVQVAETFRSQERQDTLFAQGRTTPGPVVTWTQNSKHTQGRAVDLVLDNGTAGLDAYAALQRIAGEEGLRTLGARDPGHLELPSSNVTADSGVKGAADVTSLTPDVPADATGPGQVSIARLAQVAQVTQVSVQPPAQVAHVASVAHVETPGIAAKTTSFDAMPANRENNDANHGAQPQAVQAPRHIAGNTQNASQRFAGDSSDRESGAKSGGEHRYSALAAAVALRDTSLATSPAQSVSAAPATTAAERAAKLIAAFEDAPARPLSQITMSVDAGNGTADRVQLSMRGSAVNATIDTPDARAAQTMTARSDELTRALSRDGIDLQELRVRSIGTVTTQGAVAPQSSQDTNTNSRFERGNAWQHQQDRQRSQDDRRQQREQRGGQKQ